MASLTISASDFIEPIREDVENFLEKIGKPTDSSISIYYFENGKLKIEIDD